MSEYTSSAAEVEQFRCSLRSTMMSLDAGVLQTQRASPPQSPSRTEPTPFVATLTSISKSARALSNLLLSKIDLNVGQDQLLDALDISKPITVCAVSNILNVRPSTVSKMVDRMVLKGLIERSTDKVDARLTLLHLTADGELKRQEIHALWRRLEASLSVSDATIDDRAIADALHTVDTILKKRLARLR